MEGGRVEGGDLSVLPNRARSLVLPRLLLPGESRPQVLRHQGLLRSQYPCRWEGGREGGGREGRGRGSECSSK